METLTLPTGSGKLIALTRYLVLGIDVDRRTAILAAVAYGEVAAEQLAVERQDNDVMPYKTWKVFPYGSEETFALIDTWLRTWEFTGPQIRKVIRSLCAQMTKLIEQELTQAGKLPFQTTAQAKADKEKQENKHALTRQAYRRRLNRR